MEDRDGKGPAHDQTDRKRHSWEVIYYYFVMVCALSSLKKFLISNSPQGFKPFDLVVPECQLAHPVYSCHKSLYRQHNVAHKALRFHP